MMRLRSIILAILWLGVAGVASAATLKWEINVGYSGFFRPGEWTPVMVLLDYTTPGPEGRSAQAQDITGTLEVYTRSVNNRTILSQRPIELPVSSRQRFMLYVQLSDIDTAVEVVLRNERGRRVFAEPFSGLNALKPAESLTVIPARRAVSLRLPTALEDTINQKSLTKTAVMDPLYLPDHWFGYSGVNLLLLPDYDDNMLTRLQVDALSGWVKSGGEAWALGGQNTLNFQNQLIEEILPVDITGTWTKDWNEAGQSAPAKLVVSEFKPRNGARVVVVDPQSEGSGERAPLLVDWPLGNGRVMFWAVDYANPVFAVSPFFQACWWSLYPFEVVNRPAPFYWQRFLPRMEEKMGLHKAMRFPSLVLIFLFIVIYALLVGPVNFWMLARRRKMEWGWVSVPVIIALFTALIYGYALWFKGSSFLKRDFEIWRATPGSTAVLRDARSFVFSSNRQQVSYAPRADNGYAAPHDEWDELRNMFVNGGLRFPSAGALSGGAAGAGLSPANVRDVVQTNDRGMRVPRSMIDQWAPAYYRGASLVDEPAPLIEADLRVLDANALKGTVVNSSAYDYSHAFVLFNRRVFLIDDLPAGGSAALERIQPLPRGLDGLIDAAETRLAGKDITNYQDYAEFAWLEMVRWLTNWNEFLRFVHPSNGEAVFLAMVNNPGRVPELGMSPAAKTTSRHVLAVCPLPLRTEPGAVFTLQGAEVRRGVLHCADSNYNEFVKGAMASFQLSQSSFTFMTTTAVSEGGRAPDEVLLNVRTGEPSRSENFVMNVYNYSLGRWVAFEGTPQRVGNDFVYAPEALPARQYASPINGRVFVRLDSYSTSNNFNFGGGNNITNIDVTYSYR